MSTTTGSAPVRRSYDQACPVAHALDVVGERWTLLLVRDLMFGPLRFTDLRDGLPGLAPNLLTERLRLLVDHGLVEQVELPPPAARRVYALTARGRGLAPVVHELARFGVADWSDPDRDPPPPRLVRGALLALMSPEELGADVWSAVVELPDTRVGLEVRRRDGVTALARLRLSQPPAVDDPDVVVTTSLSTLLDLRRHATTAAEATSEGRLAIKGTPRSLAQLSRLFGWAPDPQRS